MSRVFQRFYVFCFYHVLSFFNVLKLLYERVLILSLTIDTEDRQS